MATAEITIVAPMIFGRVIVSPRTMTARAIVTTTSNVEIMEVFAVSIRLSPAKRATLPRAVETSPLAAIDI